MAHCFRWAIGGCIGITFFALSCNPFAPAYDPKGLDSLNSLGDPTYIDGFFRLFKSAYELRDTALYSRLFTPDFTFVYYDAQQGQQISWDRGS